MYKALAICLVIFGLGIAAALASMTGGHNLLPYIVARVLVVSMGILVAVALLLRRRLAAHPGRVYILAVAIPAAVVMVPMAMRWMPLTWSGTERDVHVSDATVRAWHDEVGGQPIGLTLQFTLRVDDDWRGSLVPSLSWDGHLTINTNNLFAGGFSVLRGRVDPEPEVLLTQLPAFYSHFGFRRGVSYRLTFDMAPPFLMASNRKPEDEDRRLLAGYWVCVRAKAFGDDPAERARTLATLGERGAGRYRMHLFVRDHRDGSRLVQTMMEAPHLAALHEGSITAAIPLCTSW